MEKFTNEFKYFAITWFVGFSIFEIVLWFFIPKLGWLEFPFIFGVSLFLVIAAQFIGKKICYRNFFDKKLYTEPLVGYRTWGVNDTGKLRPLSADDSENVWPAMKRFESRCAKMLAHDSPDLDCTCGIYALNDSHRHPFGEVWGEVYLWGRIIITSSGYKAQYGYPKKLYVHESLQDFVVKLKNNYGCDVATYKDSESF